MKTSTADTRRGNLLYPRKLKVSKDKTFSVKIKNPNHGLLMLRILLYKFYVLGDKFCQEDLVLLQEYRTYIKDWQDNNVRLVDQKWLANHQLLKLALSFASRDCMPNWAKAQLVLLSKNIMSTRAFLGLNVRLRDYFKFLNRRLSQNPPPKRFIGVGYRDKGTARVDSIDGSPSWQQVASSNSDCEQPKLPGSENKVSFIKQYDLIPPTGN